MNYLHERDWFLPAFTLKHWNAGGGMFGRSERVSRGKASCTRVAISCGVAWGWCRWNGSKRACCWNFMSR